MVLEPNFTKVVSSVRKNITITQSQVELKLPTNENDVNKIYSVGAKSTILTKEFIGRDISFSGVVDVQAVYESNNEVLAIDYSAEFKDKYLADEELSGELIVTSNVLDVASEIVTNGIKAVIIIETTIDIIENNETSALTNVSADEVHVSTKEIIYNTYIGRAFEKFEINDEYQLSNATKILMVTPCIELQKVEPKENFIVVSGRANVNVCYQSGEGLNNIASKNFETEFNWEVALTGVEEDSIVQSSLSILFNEIKVSTIVEDGVSLVSLFMPVTFEGYVYNNYKLEVIDDLYSEKNYLSITCENIESILNDGNVLIKDNISGAVSISESSPFIDDVICSNTNTIVLASSRFSNGILSVEGVATVSVLYYTKETVSLTSVQVEMPFSIEEKVNGEESKVVTLCLSNVSARSKRGKEIEVSGELSVFVDLFSREQIPLISDINVGDVKPEDECSLYVYIVKPNQSLWDVAKDMNVSEDDLIAQNTDVQLPLNEGMKLVVYKQHVANF